MPEKPVILYMSGTLPTRSETFVYREIFALRALGMDVRTAGVHAPAMNLDDGPLRAMAQETIAVYLRGGLGIVADAIFEAACHPRATMATLGLVLCDVFGSREIPLSRRPKVLFQGLAALSLARRARPIGVTHIHSHMAHVPTTIAMYCARQLGIRFSFTGHANDLFPNRTLLAEKLSRAAWVHCISHWHRGFYRSIVERPESDYPVVRCGVETDRYEPAAAPGEDPIVLLGVGRLVEKKGFDVLLEAAGDVARQTGRRVHVRIAGSGEEWERLRAIADGLPGLVTVEMLGDTPNERILELMGEADVFVIPCRVASSGDRDGIPVVLMEAMARGRCVISGDLEAIRELVRDGQTGLMVPPGDRGALSALLCELVDDPKRIDRLGKAGRALVESEFDTWVNAKRILHAFEQHGVSTGVGS